MFYMLPYISGLKCRLRVPEKYESRGADVSSKDKQRSTKHTNKTKDRVTRTPLKIRDELSKIIYAKQIQHSAK
jgi:hypothetical protein